MRPVLLLCLLLSAGPALAAAQVILVRHAEKATDAGGDPPLSAAGKARAEALAAALADAGVSAILVTPLRRTRDTAAPIAQELGLVPQEIAVDGGAATHANAVAEAVRAQSGVVLVVGHSNTLAPIIAALGGPVLPDLCETSYAHAFVLGGIDAEPRLQRWRYGAADATPEAGCL